MSEAAKQLTSIVASYCRRKTNLYNSDWSANLLRADAKQAVPLSVRAIGVKKDGSIEFTATGYNLPMVEQLKAEYFGEWTETKYGMQFKVQSYSLIPPDTRAGIVYYLCSKQFKGIGKALAQRIVNEFGMDTLDIIQREPDRLLIVPGVTEKKLLVITKNFKATESYRKLSVLLGTYGFGSDRIATVARVLGAEAAEKVQTNPYCMTEISGIGFMAADRVARELNVLLTSVTRVRAAIMFALSEDSATHGNMWMHIDNLRNRTLQLCNAGFENVLVDEKIFHDAFLTLQHDKQVVLRGGVAVFSMRNEKAEYEVSRKLLSLLFNEIPSPRQKAYADALDEYCKSAALKPSATQKLAAKTALVNRVSVMTGGPGTGKTATIKSIIAAYRLIEGENATVIGLAPTGKAARRMTESTGVEAFTIHSRCRIFSEEMSVNDVEPLPKGLIIVDEMSMVDAYTMQKLMHAVDDDAHLVLVGDADQLPSVGAGSVLDEIIKSGVIPTTQLTEIFRQGTEAGAIIENAQKINRGQHDLEYNDRFQFLPVSSEDEALRVLLNVYEAQVQKWGMDNVSILTPLRRKRTVAVDNLNSILQNSINPKFHGSVSASINGKEFRQYDKVIQMKNTEKASNGEIGTLMEIKVDEEDGNDEVKFRIKWDNGTTVTYDREDMLNVELAYAMTIHKSQGSETKCVIMPLLSAHRCPLFRRNLFYTGVTRAKESIILIGDQNAIDLCINVADKGVRNTTLADRLVKNHARMAGKEVKS